MKSLLKGSIKSKLRLLLLSATILPISIILFITYQYATNSLRDSAIEENRMLLSKGSENISGYFDLVNKGSLTAYKVTSNNESLITELDSDEVDYHKIHLSLYYISNLVDYVAQINVYKDDDGQSFLYRNFLTSKDITINTPYRRDDPRDTFIEPPHKTHDYNTPHLIENPETPVITFHRKLYDVPINNLLGYMSVDIDLEAFDAFSKDLFNPEHENIYIVDSYNNTIIYASNPTLIGLQMEEEWYKQMDHSTDSYIQLKDKMIITEPIQNDILNWGIYKEIPNNYLFETANGMARISIVLGFILILLMILVAFYVSIHFTSPINVLIKSMDRIKKGDLKTKIQMNRDDEFGILADNYQDMMNSLNDLIEYRYKLELINKENQIKVLQSQINPHFFSNVLQAIGTEALKHHDMVIYQLILKLGNMMNYTMHANNILVPLKEEIDYTINYLELQKLRFNHTFDYFIDADDQLGQFEVPKMILQPVVENFFKHGFQKNEELKGYVHIKCSREKEKLIIQIENNGQHIPPEELSLLQEKLNTSTFPEDKIGLLNIAYRLKLYYPKDTFVHIENLSPNGVRITMSITPEVTNNENPDRR